MRMRFLAAAVFALVSGASADEYGRPTAILVSPIHEGQLVRGDDGMDHIEYDLLIVNVFPEPVTLSSVAVLDQAGKELMRKGMPFRTRPRPYLRIRGRPLFLHRRQPPLTSI